MFSRDHSCSTTLGFSHTLRAVFLWYSLPPLGGSRFFLPRPFDVFRIQVEGGVRWIGTVENMEAAQALIKTESAKQPGDFLVVNLETGQRVEIKGTAA